MSYIMRFSAAQMLKTAKFDLWWPLMTWLLTWPKNDLSSCHEFNALSNASYCVSLHGLGAALEGGVQTHTPPAGRAEHGSGVGEWIWVSHFHNICRKDLWTDMPNTAALRTACFSYLWKTVRGGVSKYPSHRRGLTLHRNRHVNKGLHKKFILGTVLNDLSS